MGLFNLKKLFNHKKNKERRKYARISNALRINFQIANDALCFNCRSTDISEGGIRLNLYREFKIGTTLKLWIYLQDVAEPVFAIGKVVWTKETPGKEYPYEAGIEFDVFDPAFHLKIKNHIQSISIEKM